MEEGARARIYSWEPITMASGATLGNNNIETGLTMNKNSSANASVSASAASRHCIYLDYNATTPVKSSVLLAMMPYLTTEYGNPSSSHAYGKAPAEAVATARRQLCEMLNVEYVEQSVVFTGCGTEANNLAIHMALRLQQLKNSTKKHVVTSNIEHPAILKYLDSQQVSYTMVECDEEGLIHYDDVIKALRRDTALVTIMLANNESGAVCTDMAKIARECRARGILCHTDAAQAVGKIHVDLANMDVDFCTVVGHKIGAPKGIGALYIRPNTSDPSNANDANLALLYGGGQEGGLRGGTENVPYIVGLGQAAANLAKKETIEKHAEHLRTLRDRLLANLLNHITAHGHPADVIRVNGPSDLEKRLPNTLNVSFLNITSANILADIGDLVAISAGSACHAGDENVVTSSVLQAMKVPSVYIRGTLRISVGVQTTLSEVDEAARIIAQKVHEVLLKVHVQEK